MARDAKFDCLFQPIKLGPKTMKNRFYQVPHCNGSGTEKPGTQAAFRAMKAEGGWGAVCTEACSIDRESDITPNTLASLWDDGDIINLRHMCDALHKWDALAGVEMWYGGGESADLYSRDVPRSVGQWTSDYAGAVYTHTMDEDDIQEVQQLYVDAAKRAIQAGFDIVYVYGSHSTAVMHFLSPFYNKREDGYGGSLENRARMWLETLAKVREACDGQAAVATRMSVDQVMGPDGIQAQVEGAGFIEMVEKEGLVDLWDINICDFLEWGEDAGPSRFYKANHQHAFTRHIRDAVKSPMLNVGRFTSPDDMAAVVSSGQCDIIGSARGSIADPFLPNKIDEGRVEDVRECIGCNVCLSRWERGTPMVCTQNPVANEEFRRGWHPEKFDKVAGAGSVLVVGAGPSGLEAARVLGMRGYDVHLVEAEKELGGHMKNVMRYPGLAEWGRVVTYRQTQLEKMKNVEIHTGQRLGADDVLNYGADKVIVATGFAWSGDGTSHITMAPIPGVDASQAQFLTPEQVMAGKQTGDRVVVLDAENYFTGIGMAEMMADQGKQVSLVTQTGNPARMTEFTLESPNIHRMLHEKGVRCVTNSWVEECEVGNEIKVKVFNLYRDGYRRSNDPVSGELPRQAGDAHEIITADSVIVVTARVSNDALFKELKERKNEWAGQEIAGIYLAGDAYAPRMLADAIYDGHRMAREFEEPNPRRSKPFLRERMIWGHDISPTA